MSFFLVRRIGFLCLLFGALGGLAACEESAPSDIDSNDTGPRDDGPADSVLRPTEHGMLTSGVAVSDVSEGSKTFHAWNIRLHGPASLDIRTQGNGPSPIRTTTFYIYRQNRGGWRGAIDKRQGIPYARKSLGLREGLYRIVVAGTLRNAGGRYTGGFQMTVACSGEGCPRPPTDGGFDGGTVAGCDPVRGIECDGDWTGQCTPACASTECCSPRRGRFTCAPRVNGVCPAADITLDERAAQSSLSFDWIFVRDDSCEVIEQCVAGRGWRRLLRFDSDTPNSGTADMYLGPPGNHRDRFEWGECHGHHHFTSYANYQLLNQNGSVAAIGHKQSFCLMDFRPHAPDATGGVYNCENQGIQQGWQDDYSSGIDCQWVDITGVDPGSYFLRVVLNSQHVLLESNYANNESRIPVAIPADIPPTCGNGEVESREECDDGNTVVGDGCGSDCIAEAGWVCDGNSPTICEQRVCGDGRVVDGENCDDGNRTPADGCGSDCLEEPGFACDGEPSTCARPVCGNGQEERPEECDDGNSVSGDGCSGVCTVEEPFRCSGTPSLCRRVVCGDQVVDREFFEWCDDGNVVNGDGCDETCGVESGWMCHGNGPSVCHIANPLDACDQGRGSGEEDCGWTNVGSYSCTPGATIHAGCNQACNIGTCTGDPVLRVCAGDVPCRGIEAIAENDDAECGIAAACEAGGCCPETAVVCPPSGRITVLTAPIVRSEPSMCSLVVR